MKRKPSNKSKVVPREPTAYDAFREEFIGSVLIDFGGKFSTASSRDITFSVQGTKKYDTCFVMRVQRAGTSLGLVRDYVLSDMYNGCTYTVDGEAVKGAGDEAQFKIPYPSNGEFEHHALEQARLDALPQPAFITALMTGAIAIILTLAKVSLHLF